MWIHRAVTCDAGAHFQQHYIAGAAVDQVVAVFVTGLEAGTIAGFQDFLAGVGDQYRFARQDIDEFILLEVPMPLAGPGAGWQAQKIDAELGQPRGIAQPAPFACPAGFVIGRGIERALQQRLGRDVDLFSHGDPQCYMPAKFASGKTGAQPPSRHS
jgi:hypothetical protein